ncbi:hypothetical protein ACOSP7_023876 [Xanthoceras sorbifolium]
MVTRLHYRPFQGLNLKEVGGTQHMGVEQSSSGYLTNSGCGTVKKILDPRGPFRNWISLMLCLTSISLDPLFFYIPVINDHKNCMYLDKKLGIMACVLRSVIDLFYMIFISFQQPTDSSAPHYSLSALYFSHGRCYILRKRACLIARKLLRSLYIIDLIAVLPLPQVVIIIIIATLRGSGLLNAVNLLKYFVLFQYVPRVVRIYPLFKKAIKTFGILVEATWAKAAFNLLLYMLAGHVFGALWYFFAIKREIECWKKALIDQTGHISHNSFNCHKSSGYKFLNDFCSAKSQNKTAAYDFGIFQDALASGVAGKTIFIQKFMYCFRWGLQSLSCFGQNLVTSIDVWENVFTISITISSVLLFIFLIGNMQIYLQSDTIRSEEMKLKVREIEQWMSFRKLSENLQRQVKKYQQHVWRETKGVDVENLLNNLPKELRRNIKSQLCLEILKKVPLFQFMDEQHWDAMCERLKPVLYPDESYIIREGEAIDEMLFIIRGTILSVSNTNNGRNTGFFNAHYLRANDFYGDELPGWALDPQSSSNLPISTRTVRALTEVEAFALMADDVKLVVSKFRHLHGRRCQHIFRFFSLRWRMWAACCIQAAWRHFCKKKLQRRKREDGERLRELAEKGPILQASSCSLGATIYASQFATKALRPIRRNGVPGASRLLKTERVPIMHLQKPADLDFTLEE